MFHLRKFKLSDFEQNAQDLTGCINGWKVYGWCTENNPKSCKLITLALDMEEVDGRHLISGMAKLIRLACLGKPLQDIYDSKKCHECHTFRRANGQEQKIHRIWPGGNVRIYFCYGSDKSIVILYGLSKRKDKLTKGEKIDLENACEEFLLCQENGLINIMVTI